MVRPISVSSFLHGMALHTCQLLTFGLHAPEAPEDFLVPKFLSSTSFEGCCKCLSASSTDMLLLLCLAAAAGVPLDVYHQSVYRFLTWDTTSDPIIWGLSTGYARLRAKEEMLDAGVDSGTAGGAASEWQAPDQVGLVICNSGSASCTCA